MSFGRPGGGNVLWTQPEAADFGCHPSGKPRWKNVGGEKTWVGSDPAAWRAFEGVESGPVWPPPAWFDALPMQVVATDETNVVLRTAAHRGGDWVVALERAFSLETDALVVRSRLLTEDPGAHGPDTLPDDDRRLWPGRGARRALLPPGGAAVAARFPAKPEVDSALRSTAAPLRAGQVETIVLENDAVLVGIVPAWAGRMMSFGRPVGQASSSMPPRARAQSNAWRQ